MHNAFMAAFSPCRFGNVEIFSAKEGTGQTSCGPVAEKAGKDTVAYRDFDILYRSCSFAKKRGQVAGNLPRGCRGKFSADGKDDIPCRFIVVAAKLGSELFSVQPEIFPNNTLDSVSIYCLLAAVHADAEPVVAGDVNPVDNSQRLSSNPFSMAVDVLVLPRFAQQIGFRQGISSHWLQVPSVAENPAIRLLISCGLWPGVG